MPRAFAARILPPPPETMTLATPLCEGVDGRKRRKDVSVDADPLMRVW